MNNKRKKKEMSESGGHLKLLDSGENKKLSFKVISCIICIFSETLDEPSSYYCYTKEVKLLYGQYETLPRK
jgi:hypothetical protein